MDEKNQPETDWKNLNPAEKNRRLYEKQKNLLDTFLQHGAISEAQYHKSLTGLREKMGIREN